MRIESSLIDREKNSDRGNTNRLLFRLDVRNSEMNDHCCLGTSFEPYAFHMRRGDMEVRVDMQDLGLNFNNK